jgi:hypothetical protein
MNQSAAVKARDNSRTWNTPFGTIGILISCVLVMSLSCREALATAITATWTPGSGNWTVPQWTFAPPTVATFPSNGGGDFFSVRIDGGAAANSQVTLNGAVEIDRLAISTGDRLRLQGGGSLRFAQDATRPGSGELLINRGGSIVGSGFLGGAGPGNGSMMLNNRGGTIIANGGVLTINPSGAAGTTTPPVTVQNGGAMGALGVGSTLLLKNSSIRQSRAGNIRTAVGGNVILEDSVVQGGAVRVAPCTTPLVCGELDLNRGSVVQGTNMLIGENGVVRVLASAFPGGTLPGRMTIQGGSVLVEAGPINPVTLTLDAGAGPADTINFSNSGNPANPGRIITNWPTALPIEGTSIIKIVGGDVTLANPTFPGGPIRGGIFLNGAVPSAALIVSDTPGPLGRTLTVGPGTIITNMPGRSGRIEGFGNVLPPGVGGVVVVTKGNSPDGGLVAANTGGRLEIGELRNEGGLVQALAGGTLALENDVFPNTGEVHIFAGGTLELKGDYQQLAESTVIEGTAIVGGTYIGTGGTTSVEGAGVLKASSIDISGGKLGGDGQLQGNVVTEGDGTLEPGDLTPAILKILGDYTQDGVLSINIAGYDLLLGEYGQLDVSGTASLGGTVMATLLGGFDPIVGSYFDILKASDLIDSGVAFDLPITPSGHGFFASFLDLDGNGNLDTLRITVPEPSTLPLVSLGLAGLLMLSQYRTSANPRKRHLGLKRGA